MVISLKSEIPSLQNETSSPYLPVQPCMLNKVVQEPARCWLCSLPSLSGDALYSSKGYLLHMGRKPGEPPAFKAL